MKYQSGMGEKVVSSMTWFSQMIGSVIVAFVGDWLLALVAFALLPITVLATGLASKVGRCVRVCVRVCLYMCVCVCVCVCNLANWPDLGWLQMFQNCSKILNNYWPSNSLFLKRTYIHAH